MDSEFKLIFLTTGEICLVSPEDFDLVNSVRWHSSEKSNRLKYAMTSDRATGKKMPMHRLIMSPSDDMVVDHINNCGLDNRRSNLRVCTQTQNAYNRRSTVTKSGYVGVVRNGSGWSASINYGGHTTRIGTFETAEEAAKVRDKAAMFHHGEFARLNFPALAVEAESATSMRDRFIRKPDSLKQSVNRVLPKRSPVSAEERRLDAGKYHGVSVEGRFGFQATINVPLPSGKKKQHYLGRYPDAESAAIAYDSASLFLRGSETNLRNFPEMAIEPKSPARIRAERRQRYTQSKYVGVTLASDKKAWRAKIKIDNKEVHLGTFKTEESAAAAYNEFKEKAVRLGLVRVASGSPIEGY
jgi:hypothetical protein